ncbi:MAG: hypothetical protein HQK65_07815 [Desulfamplus sp.]|nr:hypothetical protein [Desulfamplus sp.]
MNAIITEKQLETLLTCVRQIGIELLRQWESIDRIEIKSDHTYVTSADLYADKSLKSLLQGIKELPVYSEEDTNYGTIENCWLIDPIDGTAAFVAGIPTWALSISLILNKKIEFGLIHFPVINKTIHSMMPSDQFNMVKLKENFNLEDFICVPSDVHSRYEISFPGKVRSLGSCSSQIYYAVTGKACFSILGKPQIWDFCAGIPMLAIAGGKLFYLNGDPVNVSRLIEKKQKLSMPVIVGHNESIDGIIRMIKLKP